MLIRVLVHDSGELALSLVLLLTSHLCFFLLSSSALCIYTVFLCIGASLLESVGSFKMLAGDCRHSCHRDK